jgi:hypothetical protein
MLKYNIIINIMESSYFTKYIDNQSNNINNLDIIIFKPGYSEQLINSFRVYCFEQKLKIIENREVTLSRETIIALYPKIFSFNKDDLIFGVGWKIDTIAYLTSGISSCFLIEGDNINQKLNSFKYKIREENGKLTHPKVKLSKEEFLEKVINNIIHVVDLEELQTGLWLLFNTNE